MANLAFLSLALGILGILVTAGMGVAFAYRPSQELKELMAEGGAKRRPVAQSRRARRNEEIKDLTGSAAVSAKRVPLAKRLYRAGYFTEKDKKRFHFFQILSCVGWCLGLALFGYYTFGNTFMIAVLTAFGVLIGYIMPLAWLDRLARLRHDEMMYYLPLVIEQISIGVSSSLDIGPCVSHIIETARERRSHNPVTALFVHADKLMRSGLSFEAALIEVSEAVDMNEVRHAFMFLTQCSKHGGEVSKQLQELADSVMVQRQVQIEGKIASLPVKATGPLAAVFAGFFGLLFAGLFVRIATAFPG